MNFIWPTELTFGYLVKIHSRPSGKWSKYVRSVPKEQRREATGALKFLNSNSFRRRQINFIVEMKPQPFFEPGESSAIHTTRLSAQRIHGRLRPYFNRRFTSRMLKY